MLLNILGINYNDDLTYADTELEFVQGRTVVTTMGGTGITTVGSTMDSEPISDTLERSESSSKEPALFPILEHSAPEPVDITPNPEGPMEV